MGTISFFSSSFSSSFILFGTIIFHSCLCYAAESDNAVIQTEREALEIIVGGGGGAYSPVPFPENKDCSLPPPPPPPPPQPLCPPSPPPPSPPSYYPFPNKNLKNDFFVIKELKNTIQCDPLNKRKTWTGFNVCTYEGFTCAKLPDRNKALALAALDFNEFYFGGPKFEVMGLIDKLSDLSIFHANSNNFTGSVPKLDPKDNSRFLFELDLSNNKLTGGFPMEVLPVKSLTFLDIRFNSFTGPVPPQAFNLDLDVLFLNNNQFAQQLPDNIGSTPALYLTFANNKFTGPIPRSIGKASKLLEVLFLNNRLNGCLPYEIGFLKQTTVFDVGCNKLTGPIPHSFQCLESMQILNLAKNHFYGEVPEMLCALPKLQNLSLSHNYFTQVGPLCRKKIDEKVLDVRRNCILDLPNQRTAAQCRDFFLKNMACPNERSLTYVPCKKHGGNLRPAEMTADQQSMVVPTPAPAPPAPSPISYDALKPHKL